MLQQYLGKFTDKTVSSVNCEHRSCFEKSLAKVISQRQNFAAEKFYLK